MENQANSKSIILNNGLYLGIIGVFVSLILWATGNGHELQWVNSVVGFAAMITFIILGIKKFKEANGGYISWGQGVKIGLGISMISAVITVIYTLLFMNVIDPSFQEQAMQIQQQKWLDGGMTEEQVETFTESAKKLSRTRCHFSYDISIFCFSWFYYICNYCSNYEKIRGRILLKI